MGKIWSFIKILKVEPYVFLHTFSMSLCSITGRLLLQDKICRNTYEQEVDFCIELNSINSDPGNFKTKILAESTQFSLYSVLISTAPAIIWSLFLGSWTDKYIHGRKILICASSVSAILELLLCIINSIYFDLSAYFMLLILLPSIITGGTMAKILSVYSYVTVTTPSHLRAARYAILDVCTFLGSPLGTFVGGQLLKNTPNGSYGQLHNYVTIFIISLIGELIALAFVIITINEKIQDPEKIALINNQMVENSINDTSVNDINDNESKNESENSVTVVDDGTFIRFISYDQHENTRKWYYPIKLLFDIENVKEVWSCCTKPRENRGRTQIWIMFMSICFITFAVVGAAEVDFQFVEIAFRWSATFYSNVNSIRSIVNTALMALGVTLFVKVLKLNDINLCIIGFLSIYFNNLICGSYQHPVGYFAAMVLGSLSGVTSVAIRSKMSKLVPKEELGKIFSLLASLESLTPTLASLLFTFIFQWSIDFFPGLVFQVSAAIMIIPLISMMWIDLYTQHNDT